MGQRGETRSAGQLTKCYLLAPKDKRQLTPQSKAQQPMSTECRRRANSLGMMMTTPVEIMPMFDGLCVNDIKWVRLVEDKDTSYPIDYWIAVIRADTDRGEIDMLMRWEPHCYCHFHRHVAVTTTLVLAGEHHVMEEIAGDMQHKVRHAGSYAHTAAGNVHKEYGGAEGSILYFHMRTDDGRLFEVLDEDENLIRTATLEDFVNLAYSEQ